MMWDRRQACDSAFKSDAYSKFSVMQSRSSKGSEIRDISVYVVVELGVVSSTG